MFRFKMYTLAWGTHQNTGTDINKSLNKTESMLKMRKRNLLCLPLVHGVPIQMKIQHVIIITIITIISMGTIMLLHCKSFMKNYLPQRSPGDL